MIKVRYIIAVLVVIILSWVTGIYLTQQRIQLEAQNKIQNIRQNITPFIWDFSSETDIVSSFKKYWQRDSDSSVLKAEKESNPGLSLNFSSEQINTSLHKQLEIIGKEYLALRVMIQIKTDLNDDFFYYSPSIFIKYKENLIDLDQIEWQGENPKTGEKRILKWGEKNQKIASMVLFFKNSFRNIILDKISLPYSVQNMNEKITRIDCSGIPVNKTPVRFSGIDIFQLTETCMLPSSYMWLKAELQNKFPESILVTQDIVDNQNTNIHKVNRFYSDIPDINLKLYSWLLTILLMITIVTIRASGNKGLSGNQNLHIANPGYSYLIILFPSVFIAFAFVWKNDFDISFINYFPRYFIWAVFQQWILGYILAEKLFFRFWQNKFVSALLASLLFSMMHLPSFTLFILTFIAGFFWAICWLKYRKIIPLAISHTLLALSFYAVAPSYILYSAKVMQWYWK